MNIFALQKLYRPLVIDCSLISGGFFSINEELKRLGKIPDCQMDCFVMFYVVKGEVLLRKNDESATLKENQVFITEPALLSMETINGARLMGVQIKTKE